MYDKTGFKNSKETTGNEISGNANHDGSENSGHLSQAKEISGQLNEMSGRQNENVGKRNHDGREKLKDGHENSGNVSHTGHEGKESSGQLKVIDGNEKSKDGQASAGSVSHTGHEISGHSKLNDIFGIDGNAIFGKEMLGN